MKTGAEQKLRARSDDIRPSSAATVAASAVVAAPVVAAAEEEQEDQDDDPAAVAATPVVTTHCVSTPPSPATELCRSAAPAAVFRQVPVASICVILCWMGGC